MKILVSTIFSLLISYQISTAQTLEWLNVLCNQHGCGIYDAEIAENGKTYILTMGPNASSSNSYLFVLDENGLTETSIRFDFSLKGGNKSNLSVASDGSVYISGYTSGAFDVDPGPGTTILGSAPSVSVENYFFMLKLNSNLELEWSHQFNQNPSNVIQISTILDDQDNLYCFLGGSIFDVDIEIGSGNTNVNGNRLYTIIKYDPNGNIIWNKTTGEGSFESGWGSKLHGLTTGPNNELYVWATRALPSNQQIQTFVNYEPDSIQTSDNTIFPSSQYDGRYVSLSKYSSDGDMEWVKAFNFVESTIGTFGDVIIDDNYNIYIQAVIIWI